jgi:hypothetical protein
VDEARKLCNPLKRSEQMEFQRCGDDNKRKKRFCLLFFFAFSATFSRYINNEVLMARDIL